MADEATNGSGEDHELDPDELQRRYRDLEKKYGTLLNEKKGATQARQQLVENLKKWNDVAEEHGIDPDQLREMLSHREKADLDKARETGEVDKILANQRNKFDRERQELADELSKKDRLVTEMMIDNQLEAELDKIKVRSRLRKGAFNLHRPMMKIISDPEAKHGIRAGVELDNGQVMTLGEYIKNWAENDPDAEDYLEPSASSGGGAMPGASRGVSRTKPRSTMTAAEKSAWIRTKGKASYDALPWK